MKYLTEGPGESRGSSLTTSVPHVLKTSPEIYEKDFGQYELLPGVRSIVIRICPDLTPLSWNPLTVSVSACINLKFYVILELHITFFLFTFMS